MVAIGAACVIDVMWHLLSVFYFSVVLFLFSFLFSFWRFRDYGAYCLLLTAYISLEVYRIMTWSLPFFPYPPAKDGYWEPVTSTLNWCEEVCSREWPIITDIHRNRNYSNNAPLLRITMPPSTLRRLSTHSRTCYSCGLASRASSAAAVMDMTRSSQLPSWDIW